MATNTPNLKLYKVDPKTDGNNTFNIDTMLNDNWDKLDSELAEIETKKADKIDIPKKLPADGGNATTINNKTAAKTPLTIEKNDLVGMVNELFTSANSGKSKISTVVGNPLLATDTFQQQSDKIQTLKNTLSTILTAKNQSSTGTESLTNLIAKVNNIIEDRSKYYSNIDYKGKIQGTLLWIGTSEIYTLSSNKLYIYSRDGVLKKTIIPPTAKVITSACNNTYTVIDSGTPTGYVFYGYLYDFNNNLIQTVSHSKTYGGGSSVNSMAILKDKGLYITYIDEGGGGCYIKNLNDNRVLCYSPSMNTILFDCFITKNSDVISRDGTYFDIDKLEIGFASKLGINQIVDFEKIYLK